MILILKNEECAVFTFQNFFNRHQKMRNKALNRHFLLNLNRNFFMLLPDSPLFCYNFRIIFALYADRTITIRNYFLCCCDDHRNEVWATDHERS